MSDVREEKRRLRDVMHALRGKAQTELPEAGLWLRDRFLKQVALPAHAVISGFKTFGSEIDTQPLMSALRALGHTLALPVVTGKRQALLFRRHEDGDRLQRSAFGLDEPLPAAPAVEPDILLVPLLAFDAQRYRLGYGGGYYDRTIADLRQRKDVLTIGLGFSCQQAPAVPRDAHDARLDTIVTEIRVF